VNAVIFYSNTGQSRAVAEFFSKELEYPLVSIENSKAERYENLVLVFPVHCQNIPHAVKAFLKKVNAEYLSVIATYGGMSCGNVLYEIQRKYLKNIAAGAYVPTKHSYIDNDDAFRDFYRLAVIVEKIKSPSLIQLPKLYKNPLADIFPRLRSRLGSRIYRASGCNGCGACTRNCSFKAIRSGRTSSTCIRCLRCVNACPNKALIFKVGLWMRLYLSKKKMNKLIIYV